MGLYLVWPAFYTDVTDTYRLPRRDRLRVDLGGLYFNSVVAVVTMAIWLVWRQDALLLLVALQVLQMVKQLSPVIRANGSTSCPTRPACPICSRTWVPPCGACSPGAAASPPR